MGLLPNQLYSLGVSDFLDMYNAYKEMENVNFDKDMCKLAWQTALLMNATGRYKKVLKPTDLYRSIYEKESIDKPKKSKEELREELKNTFNI